MRKILYVFLALALSALSVHAQRARVSSATIYASQAGSGTQDCSSAANACILQTAFDTACANFDLTPPFSWSIGPGIDYGVRNGVTIQLALADAAHAYQLTQPQYVDGIGCSGPITLRGDPANPFGYFIYCANGYQGLTAQNGAFVNFVGFAIWGQLNCTFINNFHGGVATVSNVWCGPPGDGSSGGCIGAAGVGSRVDLIGPLSLWGNGFSAVFAAIEGAEIVLAPGHSINANNVMNFGTMFAFWRGHAWTQGSPPVFTGFAGSIGSQFSLSAHSFIGFSKGLIPGSAGYLDPTSYAPF